MSFFNTLRRFFRLKLNKQQRAELCEFINSMAKKAKDSHFVWTCEQKRKNIYLTQGIFFINSIVDSGCTNFTCKYTDWETIYYTFTTKLFKKFFPELEFLLKYSKEEVQQYAKENKEKIINVGDIILSCAGQAWHSYDSGGWNNYHPEIYE